METQELQNPQAQVEQQPVETQPIQQTEVTPPQVVAESTTDWQTHLNEATNGRVKTAEELAAIFGQYDETTSKYAQLEAKWNGLDAVTKKMIEMRDAGASQSEIDNWYNLQKLDVGSLSDVDAIKTKLKMDFGSNLSDSDIQEFLEEKYGDDLTALTGSKKIEFTQAVKEAKSFLNSQIVAASNPESLKSKQQIEFQQQEYLGTVQREFVALKNTDYLSNITLVTEGVDKVEGGKVEVTIPIPNEVREQVYDYAMKQIIQQGIDPKNKEAITQTMNNYLWALDGKRISDLRVKDALAKAYKEGIKENAGAVVKPEVTATSPKVAKSALDSFWDLGQK